MTGENESKPSELEQLRQQRVGAEMFLLLARFVVILVAFGTVSAVILSVGLLVLLVLVVVLDLDRGNILSLIGATLLVLGSTVLLVRGSPRVGLLRSRAVAALQEIDGKIAVLEAGESGPVHDSESAKDE